MRITRRISPPANLRRTFAALASALVATLVNSIAPAPTLAQQTTTPTAVAAPGSQLTYVDLVELALASELVLKVAISDQRNVPPDRSPGLAPGQVRLYLQAETQALLAGSGAAVASHAFLTDIPLDARGRRPRLKNQVYLLFARRVPGRPGELQLVGPSAMQPADPVLEQRVRGVLAQLVQGERPPVVTGVREVISVPGNLAGESETQIFLSTQSGAPVSLSVIRRPGMAPAWGVSWSEIVDQSARPPQADTPQWYALACFLPRTLPDSAFLQRDSDSRTRARSDYGLVLQQLGECRRSG